jgi:hypothetical protein
MKPVKSPSPSSVPKAFGREREFGGIAYLHFHICSFSNAFGNEKHYISPLSGRRSRLQGGIKGRVNVGGFI